MVSGGLEVEIYMLDIIVNIKVQTSILADGLGKVQLALFGKKDEV